MKDSITNQKSNSTNSSGLVICMTHGDLNSLKDLLVRLTFSTPYVTRKKPNFLDNVTYLVPKTSPSDCYRAVFPDKIPSAQPTTAYEHRPTVEMAKSNQSMAEENPREDIENKMFSSIFLEETKVDWEQKNTLASQAIAHEKSQST